MIRASPIESTFPMICCSTKPSREASVSITMLGRNRLESICDGSGSRPASLFIEADVTMWMSAR